MSDALRRGLVEAAISADRHLRFENDYERQAWNFRRQAIEACVKNPYQPALMWTTPGVDQALEIDLREVVSQQIYLNGITKPGLAAFFARHVKEGQTFLDVGAHFGVFSVIASKLVGDTGKVFAFEPTSDTHARLQRNIGPLANTTAVHMAVWSEATTLEFTVFRLGMSAFNSTRAMRMPDGQGEQPESIEHIEAIDLDTYCKTRNIVPDFVKIDVESAEWDVVAGMDALLSNCRPIVTVEVGDFDSLIEGGTFSSSAVLAKMESYGYELFECPVSGLRPHLRLEAAYKYDNIVCVPKEKVSSLAILVEEETFVPLVEAGVPLAFQFNGKAVPVERHTKSGYVRLDAPTHEELQHYYTTAYGGENPDYYKIDLDYDPDRCAYGVSDILNHVARFGLTGTLATHELGCAYGGLVAEMARRGHAASGSDINQSSVAEGQRVKGNMAIRAAPNIEALATLGRKIDVIHTFHTLEHDPDLFDSLEACANALTDRGVLLAVVPNAVYLRALLDGFFTHEWSAYPDHLHQISPGYIPFMCDKTGFVPLHVETRHTGSFDQWWARHFGEIHDIPRVKTVFNWMQNQLGFGLDMLIILAPKDGLVAKEWAHESEKTRTRLEVVADFEVKLRDFLAALPSET